MAGIQYKPVGIFWDIENCSVPKGKSPSDIIAHIRNFFVVNRLNHREYEFLISCDVTKLKKDVPEDINKAGGVTLAHVNASSKNAADEKLRENMKKFVDTHAKSASPVLILISGDIDFVNDLRGYQTRLGCTVVLIHATNCSSQFKVGWNEIYCFTSFCAAVRDNPALNSSATSKNNGKKEPNQKNNNQQQQGAGQPNQKSQGGQKNQDGPIEPRPKSNDPKAQKQGPTNKKTEMSQQTSPKIPNQTNEGQPFPRPGSKTKLSNNSPNNDNVFQQQPKHNNNSTLPVESAVAKMSTKDKNEKPATNKFILMVGGLPGKLDFKILKENLQFQANKVHGKVKYVKNGQAFITFKNKQNADRAVELFNGKQVFGKTLNVSFTKSIPFEDQSNDKSKSNDNASDGLDKKTGSAGVAKKSKIKDSNSGATVSNAGLSNDPVLAGLGSIIEGIVANRMAAATPSNKSPESCPIQ